MSESEFWAQSIHLLTGIRFCVHVTAFASCWIAGTQTLKYLLYVKNHKDIW